MSRFNRWLSLGLVLTLGFLVGILGFSFWDKMPTAVERVSWSPEAQWIAPRQPTYRFYARRTFYITDAVQKAWLRLSADHDFILYVNGIAIAREVSTLNNSLGLASRFTDSSQNLNDSSRYRVKTGVNYLLGNTRDWKLTAYIDLTSYLSPGKNTIALEIQKGQENARVVVEGAVYSVPDAPAINLTTGATPWQVSTLPKIHQGLQWFSPDLPDQSWPYAQAIGPVKEATYSRLSQRLFDRMLQGNWISGPESPQGEVWLRSYWQVPKTRKRAFIRFSGKGEYALLINGLLVKRYGVPDSKHLHMYDVTDFLRTGSNTLAVRLARPLDQDSSETQSGTLGFFLDGWVETDWGLPSKKASHSHSVKVDNNIGGNTLAGGISNNDTEFFAEDNSNEDVEFFAKNNVFPDAKFFNEDGSDEDTESLAEEEGWGEVDSSREDDPVEDEDTESLAEEEDWGEVDSSREDSAVESERSPVQPGITYASEPQNGITAPIATDSTWSAFNQPISGWSEGVGQGQPVSILGSPEPQQFQRSFGGNAYLLNYPNYLWHQSLWQLAGMGCASVCAWSLGRFWLGRRNGWWDSFGAGAGLLLPGTLFLIGIGLLKHRYAEEEQGLLFVQPQSTPLILLGFMAVVLLTLLWSQMGQRPQDQLSSGLETLPRSGLWFLLGLIAFVSCSLVGGIAFSWSPSILFVFFGFVQIGVLTFVSKRVRWSLSDWFKAVYDAWPSWGPWCLLVLIVGIGFALRVYKLDFTAVDSDENTSWDATKGILRTGAPIPASGIWYTRGPVYHYLLALWLRLVGDSAVNARFLSVLWGTAILVLFFIFTRKITGKIWFALVVTAILAIDPSDIWYSRFIRFYQVLQFTSLLAFWSFFKGFVYREGRVYQYVFFIDLTLNLLTQEVSLTLLPCFLIGFLFFYRPFRLSDDWSIVLGSLMTMAIFTYNIVFFSIKCLTPLVALSDSADSYLKPQLFNVSGFLCLLFVGPSRMHTLYSFFFFLGFVYFIQRRDGKLIFLFISVFLNLILLTCLVYQTASRYTYFIHPLFILLAVYSAVCITESLGRRLEFILQGLLPLRNIALGCIALLLISNIEPARILAGYQDAIARHNPQVFEYIHEHRQPGDVVIANLPSAAAIALGGLDYYLPPGFVIGFDRVYLREGRLIDRWAGGVAITNLDQMSHILEKANRVWIQLDDRRRPRTTELAQLYDYFYTLGQPVLETYGVRLLLWQRQDGLLPRVPNQGRDLGIY